MKFNISSFVTICLFAGFVGACSVAAANDKSQPTAAVGKEVPDFSLQDYRGHKHELSAVKTDFVVLAFLGTECPLARLYANRLQELSGISDRVTFIGINPNSQDSITEIAAYARTHKVSFPILKDVGNKVADMIGCTRTPEVFVLDRERRVVYQGRVDDQYGIGYVRDEPKHPELKNALNELLAGKPVSVARTDAIGCLIGRVRTPKTNSSVTYSNQVARLFQKRCVECHREGDIAPFALTEYDEVAGWADMILEVVKENRMPPWHADPAHGSFANARTLTKDERKLISDWVAAGAPEGDPKMLPEPQTFTEGWQLPRKPDQIVHMDSKPFRVPAKGTVRYQYFTVDPEFKEDKWIETAEIIPGNRNVVHHVLVFARPPRDRRDGMSGGGAFLVGYVPGLRPRSFPKGMAKLVPAGSKLHFQVHYTPIGSEQFDRSKVGFVFADPATIDQVVVTHEIRNSGFRIPPNHDNYRVEKTSDAVDIDLQLLGLMPHMHLRGKSFAYTALYPDGTKETLLDVPNYDFNWQTSYRLSETKSLPAGTRIHCVAHFDNSEKNLNNPEPTETVRWGDQTWHEMMIGYIDIAMPRESMNGKNNGPNRRTKALMSRLDKNNDQQLTRDEVRKSMLPLFERLDRNNDDIVTLDELQALTR